MYPRIKPQVFHSFRATQKDLALEYFGPSLDRTVTPPSKSLAHAISRSRLLRRLEVAGKSSKINADMAAQPIVATPAFKD